MTKYAGDFISVVLVLTWSFGACTSDTSEHLSDAAASDMDARTLEPPEGDWFVCASEACDELQTSGLRLAEHEAFHLQAATLADGGLPHFNEGDPYCVSEPFGRYEYAGDVLTLTFHDGGLTAETVLALDDSGLTTHGGDMRRVHENATGHWQDTLCLY